MQTLEHKKIIDRKLLRVLDLIIRTASLLMLAPVGLLLGVLIFINTRNGIDSVMDIILVGQMLLGLIVFVSCISPSFLFEKVFKRKITKEVIGRVPAYVFPVYFYLVIFPAISA